MLKHVDLVPCFEGTEKQIKERGLTITEDAPFKTFKLKNLNTAMFLSDKETFLPTAK